MKIAIDFDGTIVQHRYPEIGKEIPFATLTLKKLIDDGHILVLNSVREGEYLDAAVEWCRERGVEFFAANKNYPEETPESPDYSRKIKADFYIDDRNICGLPDWGTMYEMISEGKTFDDILTGNYNSAKPKKKPWWKF